MYKLYVIFHRVLKKGKKREKKKSKKKKTKKEVKVKALWGRVPSVFVFLFSFFPSLLVFLFLYTDNTLFRIKIRKKKHSHYESPG